MSAFWDSWRPPASPLPPPTFFQLSEFYAADAARYARQANDATLTPYERGRAQYRAALAATKSDECARVAVAEALFP